MKKKSLKGEISTIITLGTLIVLGVSSLASVVFLKRTQTTKTKAAGCAKVENVSYSGDVAAGKTFTCLAVTNGASPYTMACGISKNGGWPYGMQSGSCSGKNCTFSVKMDDQIEAGAVYQLVAFDFRTECGPDKDDAKRITLNVPGTQPQPTQAKCDEGCCGMPDGFIYQRAIKASCDSNYKGGRYVIIDGVCQGGKKTEKPGCATCRTCQAGERDIAPVPGADLAVNECNSSCEQREGGNPTPNPNSSTPKQTITPTPNPKGNPTNIPPSTTSTPTGSSQIGNEGQPCIKEPGEQYPFCNEGLVCFRGTCVKPGGKGQPCIKAPGDRYHCIGSLVCSEQTPNGICVAPILNNTAIINPTSQPICYSYYGPNLPNCVTPTPTPTTLPNKLNETQDNFTCSSNPNIKYCVKCVSPNKLTNQCASFQYYEEGCRKFIGTSKDDLDKYCSNTPTVVKINYIIQASGTIPFGKKNKCTYAPINFGGFSSPTITETYSYLKIYILKDNVKIFEKDEYTTPIFPVFGTTTIVDTTKEGTFQLVASYYKDYKFDALNNPNDPCEPIYETFIGEGRVRRDSIGYVVDLTVTLIGEQQREQQQQQ